MATARFRRARVAGTLSTIRTTAFRYSRNALARRGPRSIHPAHGALPWSALDAEGDASCDMEYADEDRTGLRLRGAMLWSWNDEALCGR